MGQDCTSHIATNQTNNLGSAENIEATKQNPFFSIQIPRKEKKNQAIIA